jgi:hypothetical protein
MTTYYTPPHVLDPAAGTTGYLADIVANPPFEGEPTTPPIPTIHVTEASMCCATCEQWQAMRVSVYAADDGDRRDGGYCQYLCDMSASFDWTLDGTVLTAPTFRCVEWKGRATE